ncbi:hypothetical protein HYFRA_00010267 [Hymenoscyphus fraxineus]|uniref:F-box domain-containing protein n=1 Tax=Hymenoscyphus fraxineus TaxID=746836 RepID=A0A9N9PUA1_9HELO|nr:hypothetical protein HYFRA_00010267 [Hymenoscyphus fraxineus]
MLCSDFWSVDRLQQQFGAGSEDQQRVRAAATTTATARAGRRHSDQDIITRSVRTGLPTTQFIPKHKSASSYPIYSSTPQYAQSAQSGFSSTPPFLPWGLSPSMDPLVQPQPRPASSSSISTRSSFESRQKSPLSATSSVDHDLDSISPASSISNSTDALHSSMAQNGQFRGYFNDPFPKYGEGKRQLMTPPKLSSGSAPSSPTTITFRKSYQPRIVGEGFRKLPEEILFHVLKELKASHLGPASLSCSTCYMRDLVAVGASCRKWWNVARILLYEDIQLVGSDSTFHIKKKFKIKYGTRLRLLSRTLHARPDLAEYVKSLKVPAIPEATKGGKEEEYRDLVASVIMACPNLERLPGFHTTYEHEFSRLVHALSTRRKLLERVWIISGNSSHPQPQLRRKMSETDCNSPESAPNSLSRDQCIEFLNFHSNWSNLQTLVMHCNPDGMLSSPLFTDVFKSLPSLENLHISSFPASDFNDETLQKLPALKSLRLENLPGVTDEGISNFSSHARTEKLRSLSLISLSIDSLPVLARIFSHIRNLTHFTISQVTCPSPVDIFLYPYLASPTVEYMHWEFTSPLEDRVTEILSKSISHCGFPSLRTIRAPTDFEGHLQKLCRPIEKIELPGDKYRNLGGGQGGLPISQSMPVLSSPAPSHFGSSHSYSGSTSSKDLRSPTRSAFSSIDSCSSSSSDSSSDKGVSLALSRRMAQLRIEAAKLKPQFHVITWDENGDFVERHALGGFLGQTQSKISFTLRPDLEGSDDSLMGVEALLDGSEEGNVRDGCTGSWNLDLGGRVGLAGKKEKDRWRHTERGRWRDVDIGLLF